MLLDKKTLELGTGLLMDVNPAFDYVIFRMGDREVKVPRTELWGACFAIADAETQEKLMPVRKTEVMTFEKIHNVELKHDMKKGQILKVKCHVNVPLTIEENLKGLMKPDKKVGSILT